MKGGRKIFEVAHMLKVNLSMFLIVILSFAVHAAEVSKEQIKGLDEQVQEIKSDVLSIAAELNQLEEKLLYPSHTQVAVFVSMARGEKFRLDSVDISLDGKSVTHHIYTFKEQDALIKGGMQRIYTGNIRTGAHVLQVNLRGKSAGGIDFEKTKKVTVKKDAGPKIVEVTLAYQSITFKDR